jgi:hypothetical protein
MRIKQSVLRLILLGALALSVASLRPVQAWDLVCYSDDCFLLYTNCVGTPECPVHGANCESFCWYCANGDQGCYPPE